MREHRLAGREQRAIRSSRLAKLRRRAGSLMLPATVMPEVLLRCASYPSLEGCRIIGHDAIDVCLDIAGGCGIDGLEGEPEATTRLSERDAEDDWGTEPQRENSGTSRGLGEPPKEWNPGGR